MRVRTAADMRIAGMEMFTANSSPLGPVTGTATDATPSGVAAVQFLAARVLSMIGGMTPTSTADLCDSDPAASHLRLPLRSYGGGPATAACQR